MTTIPTRGLVTAALLVPLVACEPDSPLWPSASGPAIRADRHPDDAPRFSDWSAPVNVGPPVNTADVEQGPAISKDGLSLYLQCMDCPGGFGGTDIWVSQRVGIDEPWGPPQNLGPAINTSSNESGPSLSVDGHRMYFVSNRPGGLGGNDLYVARRREKRDDFGWQAPVHLGSAINSSGNDAAPQPFVDHDGSTILFFNSNRPGGLGGGDIYASTLGPEGAFGPATLVAELSSPFDDQAPAIRRDGLEMFLASNRPGTIGQLDVWVSTRSSTAASWSQPVNLGPTVNHAFIDAGVDLSFDGTVLYFHSANRAGNVGGPFFDLWVTTRDRLRGGAGDGED